MSNDYTFFYGHTAGKKFACFSNWYPSRFEKDGLQFENTEQYLMYHKALLMEDEQMAKRILQTGDPKSVKALGRKVRNWDESKWVANRERIMYDGCLAKFSNPDNLEMKNDLLSTQGTHLVEASPYDKIWGIGLRATDEKSKNPNTWKGLNLLGKTLDKVRESLSNKL
jgi:ribA/ribD-fused uncharacterized protein